MEAWNHVQQLYGYANCHSPRGDVRPKLYAIGARDGKHYFTCKLSDCDAIHSDIRAQRARIVRIYYGVRQSNRYCISWYVHDFRLDFRCHRSANRFPICETRRPCASGLSGYLSISAQANSDRHEQVICTQATLPHRA
ncbi:hypothetical protein D3C86_1705660 [compost metagenome]